MQAHAPVFASMPLHAARCSLTSWMSDTVYKARAMMDVNCCG